MGVDVMIVIYLEILLTMCLIVVELVMLNNMKKSNEAWWRTYWIKEAILVKKIKEMDKHIIEILNNEDQEWSEENEYI